MAHVVLRNSAFGMGAQIAIKVMSFGFSVLIVRRLGVESYGQYSAVLAFVAIFAFVSDLGLSPFTVRQVARWRDSAGSAERIEGLYGSVLALRMLLSLLAVTLIVLVAALTGRSPVMIGAIALASASLVLFAFQGASDAILAGLERLDVSARAKVLNQLVFVLSGALALWLSLGYFGLIAANLLGTAVMGWVCWRALKAMGVHPRGAAASGWLSLLRASAPFGIVALTLGVSYKFDSVLLSVFRGDDETGYYNAAYNLVFSAAVFSNVVNVSLYPSLSRRVASTPDIPTKVYGRVLSYLMVLALPIAVGGWVLADQVVVFLYRDPYLPAVSALQIVIWVTPLLYLSEFLGYVVLVQGREKAVARAVMVSTGLNFALNLMLVPRFGLKGASVMTVVTEAVLVGQYLWLLLPMVRKLNWGMVLMRPLVAAAIMGCLVNGFRDLPLILNLAIGATSYFALLICLRVLGPQELQFIRGLRREGRDGLGTSDPDPEPGAVRLV